jgi:hypothetical protein
MSILEICQWLQNLGFSTAIRESILMFPVLEGSHLLGIAVMLAPTFLLDLRLLGWGWKGDSVGKIAYSFLPVTIFGGVFMVITGALLFCSEAVKCYNSLYFRIKVVALIVAAMNPLIFHTTIWRRLTQWEHLETPPGRARLAGGTSLLFWAIVVIAGRYTAYNI